MKRDRVTVSGIRRSLSIVFFVLGLLVASSAFAQVKSYTVGVDGMACPFCAYGIEKKLKGVDGVESLEIRIKEGTVDVHLGESGDVTPEEIQSAIEKAGFEIRDLHLRGKATVERRDGSAVARFTDAFTLPIAGTVTEAGKRSLKGKVVEKRGKWRLKIDESGGEE